MLLNPLFGLSGESSSEGGPSLVGEDLSDSPFQKILQSVQQAEAGDPGPSGSGYPSLAELIADVVSAEKSPLREPRDGEYVADVQEDVSKEPRSVSSNQMTDAPQAAFRDPSPCVNLEHEEILSQRVVQERQWGPQQETIGDGAPPERVAREPDATRGIDTALLPDRDTDVVTGNELDAKSQKGWKIDGRR